MCKTLYLSFCVSWLAMCKVLIIMSWIQNQLKFGIVILPHLCKEEVVSIARVNKKGFSLT